MANAPMRSVGRKRPPPVQAQARRQSPSDSARANWVQISTLILTALLGIFNAYLAITVARWDASRKEFETYGQPEYSYYSISMDYFCSSPDTHEVEIGRAAYFDTAYVKNKIWHHVRSNIDRMCQHGTADSTQTEENPPVEKIPPGTPNMLAYIEFTKPTSGLSPKLFVDVTAVTPRGSDPIWKYAGKAGKKSRIALGTVSNQRTIRLPIAAMVDFVPVGQTVLVPEYVQWTIPQTGEVRGFPLNFMIDGSNWEEVHKGYMHGGQ